LSWAYALPAPGYRLLTRASRRQVLAWLGSGADFTGPARAVQAPSGANAAPPAGDSLPRASAGPAPHAEGRREVVAFDGRAYVYEPTPECLMLAEAVEAALALALPLALAA